jgi:hypothetical protein
MNKISIRRGVIPLAALSLCALLPLESRAELVANPKRVGTSIDFGQILVHDDAQGKYEKQAITRTGVYLTASGVHNDRLLVSVTLGGLFWYPLPESPDPSRLVRFGPGVGEARAVYSFGDVEKPSAKLQFGFFPYKYNSDATNLGEYLHRSGTYPGYLWTGGWSYLNAASYTAQGAHLWVPTFDGMITHELTLFMERDITPLHDFSPGYLVTARPNSVFEVGAGVVWQNAISFKPSRLAPKTTQNAYGKTTNMPVLNAAQDPNAARGALTLADDSTGNVGYYTFRGFKTMLRASADLGQLIGAPAIKPGDFKLYSEVALLGVEDQPFYYENKLERMPVMVGLNIPTLGLLNRLAVEVEYYKSRFPNSIYYPYDSQLGIPLPMSASGSPYDYTDEAVDADPDAYSKDDWKWSVYASRQIAQGLGITLQVASDHLRHVEKEVKPSKEPATLQPDDWYYVFRLDFNL